MPLPALTVTTLSPADESRAVATMLLAFADDAVARWSFPDAPRYVEYFPRIVRAFGGGAFAHGSAFGIADHAGVALWLPPDVHPDEAAMGAAMEEALSPAELEPVMAILAQMESFHPAEPHWYLPLIGVDPAHRGRGLGTQLMAHALAHIDRHNGLSYLEATGPRNAALYERFGFERIGSIQAGDSPTFVPMVRRPRG